ncbi:MAG: choice-of-anchor Q domain-containing protein [Pseudomonadota bacterium]
MNRLRACLFALLASGLAMTAARAATIEVTTTADLTAVDGLCSLREAVQASTRATSLLLRDGNKSQITTERDTLKEEIDGRLQFAGEYYPRGDLQSLLSLMAAELEAHTPAAGAQTTARDAVVTEVNDVRTDIDALPDNKVYLADVQRVYDAVLDVLEQIQLEIDRLDQRNAGDGCKDGSSFDTVMLPEGTHVLDTELVIDARIDLFGAGDASIISAGGTNRLLVLAEDRTISISKLQLQGGDAGTGDGGALFAGGSVEMTDVLISGNTARDGGGIFVDVFGSLKGERIRFFGNAATRDGGAVAAISPRVELLDVTFGRAPATDGNQAAGNGGAIYFNPQSVPDPDALPRVYQAGSGTLLLDRASLVNNAATIGSAIYVGPNAAYTGSTDAQLGVVNATFSGNAAANRATLEFASVSSTPPETARLSIKNVTMLENSAVTGTGGVSVVNPARTVIDNSLLAMNTGGGDLDCELSGSMPDANNFNRNYYDDTTACEGGIYSIATPLNTNYQLTAAQPAVGYLVNAFDAVDGVYLPVYPLDVNDPAEIRLVSRGASTQEQFRCSDRDQRNLERLSFVDADCDIGAVEYQIGRRVDDSVTTFIDQTKCFDVASNDIGDAVYTQWSLEVLAVERAGARAVVASSDVAGYQLAHPGVPVVDIASCPNLADLPVGLQEAILFTPPRGFYGETNVTYRLAWSTGGIAAPGGTVSGIAHVNSESRRGISSDSLGGAVGSGSLLLALLALRRRSRPAAWRVASLLILLGLPAAATAAENIIYVNSAADPLVLQAAAGDGECTLREALETARNGTANLTRGDCLDGNEGPDIIEFVRDPSSATPDLINVVLTRPLTAYSGVTIRCPVVDNPLLVCAITGNDTFALIDSTGSIVIDGMTLQNGFAGPADTLGNPTANGGAINSAGGVSIARATFRDNRARTGGAIFLRGAHSDLTIVDSTFSNNASTGTGDEGGGVVAMAAGADHKIAITGSTFNGNTSVSEAAVLNIKTTSTVTIANSTFSGNVSSAGPGVLNLDGSFQPATLRNLTVVGNRSGTGRFALEFGLNLSEDKLVNSIVAANFGPSPSTQDQNCSDASGNYMQSSFNLYGEDALAPTCTVGADDQILPATTVYDAVTPSNGYLLALALNGFTTRTHAPNIANPAVFGTVVDAGYNLKPTVDENLVKPLDLGSLQCADVDQRGKTRRAGGRCDIGAYEYEVVTAVADKADNRNRHDRIAISDILANDITEEGKECVPDAFDGPTLVGAGPMMTVRAYRQTPLPQRTCAIVTFDSTQGEAYFLRVIDAPEPARPDRRIVEDGNPDFEFEIETESPMVLAYRDRDEDAATDPFDLADDWADEVILEVSPRSLQYQAGDSDGNLSLPADIEIAILNIPPFLKNDRVVVGPGQGAVINILANDIDYDRGIDPPPVTDECASNGMNPCFDVTKAKRLSATGLDLDTLTISGSACNDNEDTGDIDNDGNVTETYYACAVGDVFINQNTGALTWMPRNSFNRFSETITYQVSDYAYPKSDNAIATVTIVVESPDANGGGMFGDDDLSDKLGIDFLGTVGHLFFAALGLAAFRRRR